MNPANENRRETSNAPRGARGLSLLSAHDPISNKERPNMKTKNTTTGRIAGFAIAVALFAVTTGAGSAQEKGSAKGGATMLLQLNTPKATAPITLPDYKPMACAHCKDRVITVRDSDMRGAGARTLVSGGAPTKTIAKHLCNACGNDWVVSGHGKMTTFLAVHTCASCL
jgi:hypothetical protein